MQQYFTISVIQEGITGQLANFAALYRLGRSLGYEFAYTDLRWTRSGFEGIYEFLGLNHLYTKTARDILPDCELVDFPINEIDHNFDLYTYPKLSRFVEETVAEAAERSGKPVCARFWFWSNHPVKTHQMPEVPGIVRDPRIVEVTREERDKKPFLRSAVISSWFEGTDKDPLPPATMRANYFRARVAQPRPTRFTAGKTKVLVHVRQGDTAAIETPWNTFIPTWKRGVYEESQNLDELTKDLARMSVQEFADFLELFTSAFPAGTFSTIVSSDGFEKGIRNVLNHASGRGPNRINLTPQKVTLLEASIADYDTKHFKCLETVEDCTCLIGETTENLLDLIHCAMEADVIVFGPQQRFIVKLMSLYGDPGTAPLLIMLDKKATTPSVVQPLAVPILKHELGTDIGPVIQAVKAKIGAP